VILRRFIYITGSSPLHCQLSLLGFCYWI